MLQGWPELCATFGPWWTWLERCCEMRRRRFFAIMPCMQRTRGRRGAACQGGACRTLRAHRSFIGHSVLVPKYFAHLECRRFRLGTSSVGSLTWCSHVFGFWLVQSCALCGSGRLKTPPGLVFRRGGDCLSMRFARCLGSAPAVLRIARRPGPWRPSLLSSHTSPSSRSCFLSELSGVALWRAIARQGWQCRIVVGALLVATR